MKALVYLGPETLGYQDMPDPVPGPGQVLIEIASAGICGSDMHAYLGHDARRPAPLILGHEIAGTVRGGAMDGTRVTVNPLVSCGTCRACRAGRDNICPDRQILSMPPCHGGFATAVAVAETNLTAVPDHVSFDAAALAEPIACGWHALRLARRIMDDGAARALVLGGGAIGLGAALSARAQGVRDVTIVEPNDLRRAYLTKHCGEHACASAGDTDGDFDIVVDAVGIAATRADASAMVRAGGVIVHIGLGSASGGLDVRRMTLQEIAFVGTYTYTAQDFRDTAAAMFDGRLGALDWTAARPLADGAAAFTTIRAGTASAPKIILKPD